MEPLIPLSPWFLMREPCWLNQHYQARAGERTREISQREDLFRDFIVAASKAYGEALISEEPRIEELVALYGMVSRMRVSCSPRTVARAEEVMHVTMGTYFASNKTIQELHELVKSAAGMDPLKDSPRPRARSCVPDDVGAT